MKFISHRGNLYGSVPAMENHPMHIEAALKSGFDVEVDVWYHNDDLYLGHDEPQYRIPPYYKNHSSLWYHAKNIEALKYLQVFRRDSTIKYFWHQEDDYTLTSNDKIWVYPGKQLVPESIAVMPERSYEGDLWRCFAICTDYVYKYKEAYESRNTN